MRHFPNIHDPELSRLFYKEPQELRVDSDRLVLAVGLGATLYTPANRADLVKDILRQRDLGCTSLVLCLEDSIPDAEVSAAEKNVVGAIRLLQQTHDDLPLLFVRVRTAEQMISLSRSIGAAMKVLTGFVIPKFDNELGRGQSFIDALHQVQVESGFDGNHGGRRLQIMPILESTAVIHLQTREKALNNIFKLLTANRADVLSVRIGATDMSSAFGLRRSRDLTIYDVHVVAGVIGDIVNVLGRPDGGFAISGPVWEHYSNTERVLRPQLRATPFAAPSERELRTRIMTENWDTLIREIELDLANGLVGKTVIHPSHIALVHALNVVSHEEFLDAEAIAGNSRGGATASPYGNKMNEMKPHRAWAHRTLLRADAFGVSNPGITFVDLLEACMS
ncbi:HpcH/HpaI aldolase/citrate lyase family protein [Arthrobacter cryoconiti]|uniref:HpcH/HpaI aldolase/citrate lyase family protein n=1 Tax=Arthrobacter cryoconiti TaxID=748907 RepID=A0ABV8QZY6_9MICC|nr:HpcH/HpaI aldolase/citrate lyase family protein [Arthrobacter cryoconiti]MCC9067312.1 HpcH/HpaI aldolase/citrate lyase family protein [Arthrobacter cryoconiti]